MIVLLVVLVLGGVIGGVVGGTVIQTQAQSQQGDSNNATDLTGADAVPLSRLDSTSEFPTDTSSFEPFSSASPSLPSFIHS